MSIAGHPEYVGVITISNCSSSILTSRTIPMSVMVSTGTSGSVTFERMYQAVLICFMAGVVIRFCTTLQLDMPVADIAIRPTGNPDVRCAHLVYRQYA